MRQKKAYEEIKMENLPNLLKDINLNIPKSNKHLIGLNITKPKFKNIIVNFLKTKVKSKSSKQPEESNALHTGSNISPDY